MFHVAFGIVLGVFFLILIYYVIIPWLFLFLASRETLGEEYEVGFEFADNKGSFRIIAKVIAESVEQAIAVATIQKYREIRKRKIKKVILYRGDTALRVRIDNADKDTPIESN